MKDIFTLSIYFACYDRRKIIKDRFQLVWSDYTSVSLISKQSINKEKIFSISITINRSRVLFGSEICDKRFSISSYFGAMLINIFDNNISIFVKLSFVVCVDSKFLIYVRN